MIELPPPPSRRVHQWRSAIDAYHAAMPPGGILRTKLSPLDHTGVPVWVVSFRGDDGLLIDGIGYGSCDEEALCGAYGELTETVMTHHRMKSIETRQRESFAAMRKRFGEEVIDPRTLCLTAGTDWDVDRPADWVPVRRYVDDARRWVPREFVAHRTYQLGPSDPLITPITNGLGAGPSRAHCVEHALCELLQRDGNCTAFRALDRGVVIELDEITDDETRRLIQAAAAGGIRVVPKLARTEFGHVNVFVVGDDTDRDPWFPPQVTACGEAAHPDREAAIRKATLEFLAARARKAFMHGPLDRIDAITPDDYLESYRGRFRLDDEEPRALETMSGWVTSDADRLRSLLAETAHSENRHVALSTLPTLAAGFDPDRSDERLGGLIESLQHDDHIDVLYLDLGDESSADADVHAVRVIAPGLECETMSYGRIGRRGVRRAIDEGLDFVSLGRTERHVAPVLLPDDHAAEFDAPPHVDLKRIDEIVGDLYPLYREPRAHAVQIALESTPTGQPVTVHCQSQRA